MLWVGSPLQISRNTTIDEEQYRTQKVQELVIWQNSVLKKKIYVYITSIIEISMMSMNRIIETTG